MARRMNLFVCVLIIVGAIAGCNAGELSGEASVEPSAKRPVAKYPKTVHDFGKVSHGVVLTHEFSVVNAGDTPLVIKKIHSSCGCTAALVTEDTIAPGKEGRINTTFNTRGYSGKTVMHLFVETNDRKNPRQELRLLAHIEVPPQPKIELDVYNLDLGLSLQDEETAAFVKISNPGELELRVEAEHRDIAFFVGGKPARFPLRIRAGGAVDIELRFPGEKKRGSVRDYVLFKSNDPMRSSLSIFVTRYILTRSELKALFEKYKDVIR